MDREVTEGKMMVGAARAANVHLLVWSGLENFSDISSRKHTVTCVSRRCHATSRHFTQSRIVAEHGCLRLRGHHLGSRDGEAVGRNPMEEDPYVQVGEDQ
ncbi:hypothetical protein FRB98_004171 [Tulasnella sp. 332]|nr:hypothetical protein FRB98_004171 [Tulasnella sp. 332]